MINEIEDKDLKQTITKEVLDSLPEWFADPKAVKDYAEKSRDLTFFAYYGEGEALGFIALEVHGPYGEIFVMGVKPGYRHQGIGRALYREAESYLGKKGCVRLLVKTLAEEADYEPYEETREFYLAMGFKPLMTTKEVWGEENPCLIMEKRLHMSVQ